MFRRRGMRNIRISVNAAGRVRINLPRWVPYRTGERFALQHRDWIEQQLSVKKLRPINDGDVVGLGAIVEIRPTGGKRTISQVSINRIVLRTPLDVASQEFQKKARAACERSLRLQAEDYLPKRTAQLARRAGLKYNRLAVRRLSSRWGSCSHHKNISLSFFMMQLPPELIDYIIFHELVHTEQMNHGADFWTHMEKILPDAKTIRRRLRGFQPELMPNHGN